MTRTTKLLLAIIAVFAIGLFLGSPDALAFVPHCVKGKLCGNTCIEVTKVCYEDIRPTLESCQAVLQNWGPLAIPCDAHGECDPNYWLRECLSSPREAWPVWDCLAKADPADEQSTWSALRACGLVSSSP